MSLDIKSTLTVKHCLVCEDIRFEQRSLSSLMGVYGALPEVAMYVHAFEQPLILCFVFFTGESESPGHKELRLVVSGSDGQEIKGDKPALTIRVPQVEGQASIFAFRFNGTFPRHGIYRVSLVERDGNEIFGETFKLVPFSEKVKT